MSQPAPAPSPAPPGPIAVVTPWYPTADKPYGGAFVRAWTRALALGPERLTVIHLEMVAPGDARQPSQSEAPEGRLMWTPVKVGHNLPRAAAAEAQAEALTGPALAALEAAAVVFAHVGLPTGVAVSRRLRPGQRLILAEHASYVPALLARRDTGALYGQLVAMSDAVVTAGERTAARLRAAFPDARAKIWAVGNPLEPDLFPFRGRAAGDLERWLYVGNLQASKGVFEVVEAFAAHLKGRGAGGGAQLELVGQGVDRPRLEALVARLGLAGRVSFLGGLAPAAVAGAMDRADLLIHLSPAETFGVAPLEGLLSGLPVVVARNDGTAQTMAPALAAGRAVMVEAGGGARAAAAAAAAAGELGRLAAASGEAGALAVRQALLQAYGREAFGEMERRLAAGRAPFGGPRAGARPLVAVAVTRAAWESLADPIRAALAQGRPVSAIGPDPALAAMFDARVKILVVADPDGLGRALTRVFPLVLAAPLLAATRLSRIGARLWGRLAGLHGRLSRAVTRFDRWRRRRLEPAIRRATFSPKAAAALAAAALPPPRHPGAPGDPGAPGEMAELGGSGHPADRGDLGDLGGLGGAEVIVARADPPALARGIGRGAKVTLA